MTDNVIRMRQSATIVDRIGQWLAVLGKPLAPGRSNPDNDLIYLLIDAREHISEITRYAKSLEASMAVRSRAALEEK